MGPINEKMCHASFVSLKIVQATSSVSFANRQLMYPRKIGEVGKNGKIKTKLQKRFFEFFFLTVGIGACSC